MTTKKVICYKSSALTSTLQEGRSHQQRRGDHWPQDFQSSRVPAPAQDDLLSQVFQLMLGMGTEYEDRVNDPSEQVRLNVSQRRYKFETI